MSEVVTTALSALLAKHTFFASILYSELKLIAADTKEQMPSGCESAATDGKRLWVYVPWFTTLSNAERVFVLAHEVLHCVFLHMQRGKRYSDTGAGPDGEAFSGKKHNAACDYVINAALQEAGIGAMPAQGLWDQRFSGSMSSDEVYCLLPDDPKGEGFDKHIPAEVAGGDEQTMAVAVEQAISAAKAAGNMPASLGALVEKLLNPTVAWEEVLRRAIVTNAGKIENSWAKVNRRRLVMGGVVMPAMTGSTCGTVVAVIDTSGSISPKDAAAFLAEVKSICDDHHPEHVYLLWTDTQVAKCEDFSDMSEMDTIIARCLGGGRLPGGGGTDMPAAFAYMAEWGISPTTCIVFTDGYTPFGSPQTYPVVWAITEESKLNAPSFGTVVHCKIN